jgi:hypothetical protein
LLPETVDPSETITRFIHSSQHFAASTGRVKAAAIGPATNKLTDRLETSVYRADGASLDELWAICADHVDDAQNGRVMKARGTCRAETILNSSLSFDADGIPHPRHANLVGWPIPKHEWKIIQQKIADAMTLDVRPHG